jgi:hypothetical protein
LGGPNVAVMLPQCCRKVAQTKQTANLDPSKLTHLWNSRGLGQGRAWGLGPGSWGQPQSAFTVNGGLVVYYCLRNCGLAWDDSVMSHGLELFTRPTRFDEEIHPLVQLAEAYQSGRISASQD